MTGWTPPGPPIDEGPQIPESAAPDGAAPEDVPGAVPRRYGRFESLPNNYDDVAPSQTMAGWALGLSIVPCFGSWLVGGGLGIATLVKSQDGRNHGKKKAIAAIVIASLWTMAVIAAVVVGVLSGAERDDDGNVTSAGDVTVTDLRTGDCVQDQLDETEQTTVAVTPCDEPHYAEVYADFELEAEEFPGLAEVERLAEGGCTSRLPASASTDPAVQRLRLYYLYPNTEANFRIDRTVSCLGSSTVPLEGRVIELD